MNNRKVWLCTLLVIIMMIFVPACSGPQAAQEPAAQQPAVEEPAAQQPAAEEPAVETPTELKIAIGAVFLEEAWVTSLLQSIERVIAEKPHGLTISYDIIEDFSFADAPRILGQVAETGEYDIIWAHSTFFEAVKPLMEEYPEIVWVVAGAGNEPLGKNAWYMEITGYESAYLIGMLAGLMTETDTIGAVAEYPFPIMNSLMNAYAEGAEAVNPEIKVKYSFIESFFDPPKALESATAQIATGADFIYSMPIGPIEACMDAEVFCFGHYVDQNDLGPDVVLTSTMILWDPHWRAVIDAWWNHKVNGAPYDAPMEAVLFSLSEGGTDLAPFHGLESKIPADVMQQVTDARQAMIDGKLVVEFNGEPPQ